MQNQDKQYYIYLRTTKERIPVTEEEFHNYYSEIDTYRKKQQRHGKCVCPASKRLDCDMDCGTCPFVRSGDSLSLDYTISDDEGNETTLGDTLPSPEPLIDELVATNDAMTRILSRLTELMPQAIEIGELRQCGYTEDAIAEKIGIGRKTYAYRLNKAKEMLKKEFPEFF